LRVEEVEIYLARAAQAEAEAASVADCVIKERYLTMAAAWRALARRAGPHGKAAATE
jgi:hypothetical protein